MKKRWMFPLLVLCGIALFIGAILLQGLVIWGIGTFVVWAFKIDAVFTFWQATAVSLLLAIFNTIFKR